MQTYYCGGYDEDRIEFVPRNRRIGASRDGLVVRPRPTALTKADWVTETDEEAA